MARLRPLSHRSLAGLALTTLALGLVVVGSPRVRAQEGKPDGKPDATGTGIPAQRLVFATYHYDYQGDPRKPVPFQGVRAKNGLSLLTNHPWESAGPWLSFDRAQWHKNHFQLMAAGGVDVALAVYKGDRASRQAYAIKGLDVMTQGLKELRSEGLGPFTQSREFPQIALALDLQGLADQYGGPVDLKDADVQRSLYGMVRDFYTHVPEEFRATVQLPASRLVGDPVKTLGPSNTPAGTAYVVRLMGDAAVKDANASVLTNVGTRFAREFGARLVWVGTPALQAKVGTFDAVSPYPGATQPSVINTEGWITTGAYGPGYDDGAQGPATQIRPRENGNQTVLDFRRIHNDSPNWLFIDSWNGFGRGTDIAPSLEYGLLYRDLVRGALYQYKGSSDYAATIFKANTPRVMQPGAIYQVDAVVQNSGSADWDAFNGAALSYRWLRNGKPVGDPGSSVPSNGQARGESKTYLIGVTSPIKEGKPEPAGEYELEFNLNRRVGDELVWFDPDSTSAFRVPVTVGNAPSARPTFVSSTMTTMGRRGATYPAEVRLRNDGSDTWKKGEVSLGYRWRKVSTYLKGGAPDSDVVVAEGKRIPLEADVAPGRLITVEAPVSIAGADTTPLPTWSAKDDWCYLLEWDVYLGGKYLSTTGGSVYREAVEVVDRDAGAQFLGCSLPSELVAGRTEKVTVGLRNAGPEAWIKDRDKVVVHWYYMDGTEASWNDDTLPLPEDVPPFSRVQVQVPVDSGLKVPGAEEPKKKRDKNAPKFKTETIVRDAVLREVPVRVPYYFGPMYCVFDFQHDGMNASTGTSTKGNDVLVIPVNVYSPTFTPLPVAALYNLDGVSPDVDRGDGSIDGRGNTLPAEFLPPFVNRPSVGVGPGGLAQNPLYPSGLWARPLNDFDGPRACFVYPNKQSGQPNLIQCAGQQIPVPPLPRTAVHVMALSTEEDVAGEFILTYADGTVDRKKVTFTHWNFAPKHGEWIAFSTPHRHTRAGDDPTTRCYINHYVVPVDRLKQLVQVELPRNPAVKIMAITLESSGLRAMP